MKNDLMSLILSRRSVRSYKPDPVPAELLDAVLEAGTYAPTGSGKQSPTIIAVTSPHYRETLSRLNAAVMGASSDPYYGAPVVVLVLADGGASTFVEDGSCVLDNMMLAAHALGLGDVLQDAFLVRGQLFGLLHDELLKSRMIPACDLLKVRARHSPLASWGGGCRRQPWPRACPGPPAGAGIRAGGPGRTAMARAREALPALPLGLPCSKGKPQMASVKDAEGNFRDFVAADRPCRYGGCHPPGEKRRYVPARRGPAVPQGHG